MIVFVGDYVKTRRGKQFHQVVEIVDYMTVKLSNGRKCKADSYSIKQLMSENEYKEIALRY